MFKRKNKNKCGLWDCEERIPDDSFLCEAHYQGWTQGLIDRCPKCGRFKETMYQFCMDCYIERPVPRWEPPVDVPVQKPERKVEYSEAWVDGYLQPERVYVYIFEFDEGDFRIGYAKDVRKQFAEYRGSQVSPEAEGSPRLQYLELIANPVAAELREAELKRLIESNPDQIRLMITEFHRHLREFGLE